MFKCILPWYKNVNTPVLYAVYRYTAGTAQFVLLKLLLVDCFMIMLKTILLFHIMSTLD